MTRIALYIAGLGAAGLMALATAPAAAQAPPSSSGPVATSPMEVLGKPSDAGLIAITPSRIGSSAREMNRGRPTPFQVRMSPREARRHARELVEMAEIQCDVAEAEIVAYTFDNVPLMEVDCVQGGGLVLMDTLPIQATDCLDLATPAEQEADGGFVLSCRLPGNVAVVNAARQSASN